MVLMLFLCGFRSFMMSPGLDIKKVWTQLLLFKYVISEPLLSNRILHRPNM